MADRDPSTWPGKDREYASEQAATVAYRSWVSDETIRISNQRWAFEIVPPSPAKDQLRKSMADRARWLLDHGHFGAADQLLEFLPEADAEALLK